jgi:hypothetical protein
VRRPHPHVGKDSAETVGIEVHGNTEGKEYADDLRSICEPEIQVRKSAFWARRYYVDTAGRNKTAIQKYIQNQLREDQVMDQISMKEFLDPFTGEPTKDRK